MRKVASIMDDEDIFGLLIVGTRNGVHVSRRVRNENLNAKTLMEIVGILESVKHDILNEIRENAYE